MYDSANDAGDALKVSSKECIQFLAANIHCVLHYRASSVHTNKNVFDASFVAFANQKFKDLV